jgi:GNAT superfamily N-acetyltransferase
MVIPYHSIHQKAVIDIANLTLGKAYLDAKSITEFYDKGCLGFVYQENLQVTGFAFALISNTESLITDYRLPEKFIPHMAIEKIALLKTMAIHPKFQKHGFGAAIMGALLLAAEKEKINTIYVVAWKSEQKINLGPLLLQFGFTEIISLVNFWREDSLAKKYACPACGGPPCTCDAVIFKKTSTLS